MIRNWNYKSVFLQIMGVFIARAIIGNISPFVIGFFVVMYLGDKNRLFTVICILFGLVTALPAIAVLKYLTIMVTVLVLVSLMERKNLSLTTFYLGLMASLVTASISMASNLFSPNMGQAVILALAEGVSVIAFATVFSKGIQGILTKRISQSLNNEEIISVSIMLAIWIYGLPKISETSYVIQAFVCLFLLLFVGYKYGAGYGSIIGVTCGITMSVLSGSYSMIGFFCILGILAGTFRELGRLTVALLFLIGATAIFAFFEGASIDVWMMQDSTIPVGVSSQSVLFKSIFREGVLPLISGVCLVSSLTGIYSL